MTGKFKNSLAKYSHSRGGSRIPRRRGRQPCGGGAPTLLGGGAPTYDFAKFSEKPYEIEKTLVRRGGGAGAPP